MIERMIRNLFLPTGENNNVPLILSRKGFIFLVIIGLVGLSPIIYIQSNFIASLIPPPKAFQKEDVVSLINHSREALNLNRLQENLSLQKAAERKAEDIFEKQYFSHITPEGRQPWYFLELAEYRYNAAGENLAKSFITAETAHGAFMSSHSHRANILNPLYTEVGVAVKSGIFNKEPTIVIVQFFGQPAMPTAIAETPPAISPSPAVTTPEIQTPVAEVEKKEETPSGLAIGSRGQEIIEIQEMLALDKEVYPEGLVTGYFGPLTRQAVERFQIKYSVEEPAGVGIIGEVTRSKITEVFKDRLQLAVLGGQTTQPLEPIEKNRIGFMVLAAFLIALTSISYALMTIRTGGLHPAVTLRTGTIVIFLASVIIFGNYHSIIIPELNEAPQIEVVQDEK